ncbi:rho GTPase-activating protein 2 [Senna tora]|uniref:Rho GTPase-activating protein 2 n=1 Tax=Senna tora TaxID=362788 RepID=A0A834SY04_9FABA|nr:rho GTPase-activating protein 2 [Senna tora]
MVDRHDDVISTVHHMEIGWPTNVQHITHVTFDLFNASSVFPLSSRLIEIPDQKEEEDRRNGEAVMAA